MNFGKKISFIPKKPLTRKTEKTKHPVGLLLFATYFIFFATIAFYGGLYLYNKSIKNTLIEKTKELETEKTKIDPFSVVEKGEKLQKKINGAQSLLNKHLAPSSVFSILEKAILKSITLQEFSLGLDDSTGGNNDAYKNVDDKQTATDPDFIIKTKGIAINYESLAYQSDVLKKETEKRQEIKGFSIKDLSLDSSGNVSFNLSIIVDRSFLLYKNMFTANNREAQQAQVNVNVDVPAAPPIEEDVVDKNTEVKKTKTVDTNTGKEATPSLFEKFIDSFKNYK